MNQELKEKIIQFRDDRNWRQFHNPKDLAISISLEAAELLEVFQWSGGDLNAENKKEELAEEIADVLIYSVLLCDVLALDTDEIMAKKLGKNCEKYPVEIAYGSKEKYNKLKASKEV